MNERLARLTHFTPQQLAHLESRQQQRGGQHQQREAVATVCRTESPHQAPMTSAQRSLWFLEHCSPGGSAYTISLALQLGGQLRPALLRSSLNLLIARHEALRAVFVRGEQDFVQRFLPPFAFPLQIYDLSLLAEEQALSLARTCREEQASQTFDLATGPLLRGSLCRVHPTLHILHITIHHIIFDAWSMKIFYQELGHIYTLLCAGPPVQQLPEPGLQFGDYALWQESWLESERAREQRLYWSNQLHGASLFQRFPADRQRVAQATCAGKRQRFVFPEALMQAIRQLGQSENVTVYMSLITAWALLLARSLGRDELVVGSPTANRAAHTAGAIGFFVNTLLLRYDFSDNPAWREMLHRAKQTVRGALAHQEFPYEVLIHQLQGQAAPEETASLQIKCIYQNIPDIFTLPLPDLEVTFLDVQSGSAPCDLLLDIVDTPGETVGEIEYRSDLFSDSTIAQLAQDYLQILQLAVLDPQRRYRTFARTLPARKGEPPMESVSQGEPRNMACKEVQPSVVQIQEENLVLFRHQQSQPPLPLLGEPAEPHIDLAGWLASHRAQLASHLSNAGAILFRQFAISSVEAFQLVARALSGELLDYTERSTPRSTVAGKILTSTEYPADQSIQMHSEMSYTSHWPGKIWFYCLQPAQEGGITPLADNRQVYRLLDPSVRRLFEEKQVMYVRNYGEQLDLPWQEVFQTGDVAEVEAYCRQAGINFRWQGQQLRTWQVSQAVIQHPATHDMLWFNQAHLFHSSSLDARVRASLLQVMEEDALPRTACFGDGSPIDDAIIAHIRDVYRQVTVRIPWQRGDLVLLDNMLTAHGRDPFTGPRRIVVAMAEKYSAR